MSVTFTSCDADDDYIAYSLEGTWRGNMQVSSVYDGVTYYSTYSEICFLRDPYTFSSGDGYWVDYYNTYGWGRNYVANHIQWQVINGAILVYFVEEGSSFYITDYGLHDGYFYGYIWDGDNKVYFELVQTSSPNWNNYIFDWDYSYYAKTRSAADNGKVVAPAMPKRQFGAMDVER